MSDLFDVRRRELIEREQPLAARMRPRTLDEFVGQDHIVGPGRLLRRAIQADQLSSLIFYGPPGTGKTTLARIIANTTRAHFIAINAVLAGVKDIRDAIEIAQERRGMYGQKTILFVDEVHRFNKAQQDALLPHVENGTVILIGATTENPYFEVNKALVSRSRIFQLKPLSEEDLRKIARQALSDPERGYGRLKVQIEEEALDHLVNVANGDARAVLNALELAVETTPPDVDGVIRIDLAVAEESIQRRAVLYDKEGDVHFDTISAFIKSLRGSDPDAALYWLAKMIYAGEDPRFIFRRMLIFAGEDVGLADPNAIRVVTACAQAFDYVGMPEGRFHLAEACLYLATAPKSNSTLGFFDALKTVEEEPEGEVPSHLRDASRDREGFGHGEGYLYPHAYRDHWVAQQYLPDSLQGKTFYTPSDQGYEATIADRVAQRREAQLAAMLEGEYTAVPEILTFTGAAVDRQTERWLQRTISNAGERLGRLRERVLSRAGLQRHHVVLDLHTASGLLTWEALRRTPEGGVYALARTAREAQALQQMAERLPELRRPFILQGDLQHLDALLTAQTADLRFDAIVGRNALMAEPDKGAVAAVLAKWLKEGGKISLVDAIPRHTQRLYRLLPSGALPSALEERLQEAEEAIYLDPENSMVNWDAEDLVTVFVRAGFQILEWQEELETAEHRISPALLDRWFGQGEDARPSYAGHLRRFFSADEVAQIEHIFRSELSAAVVSWQTKLIYLVAQSGG
ncbi:MAG: AAA family ATPase [Caldilineae bacterium]|nr:MAG: AAA family ATPase [Caldilineae bacterium]